MSEPIHLVGQGLAGSVLAWRLIRAGFEVRVFDQVYPGRSSVIAPGLFTPITGKRLAQPWGAPEVHRVARAFYEEVATETGEHFYHPMSALRVFDKAEERSAWEERRERPEIARWVEAEHDQLPAFSGSHGGISLRNAGWVNLPVFLEAVRTWLMGKGAWTFEPPPTGARTIYCTGHRWPAAFDFIPLRPCKGDVMLVRTEATLDTRTILHRGVYVLPISDHLARVGGVFRRAFDDTEPEASARKEILAGLHGLIPGAVEVLEHVSGIRPSTSHFRPIAGFLPDRPKLGVFNSLGSKGVLFAPLAAEQFVQHLMDGSRMDSQVDLHTYVNKYRDPDRGTGGGL